LEQVRRILNELDRRGNNPLLFSSSAWRITPGCTRPFALIPFDYDNQIYWEEMRRGDVARFLEEIVTETFPKELHIEFAGAAQVSAVDKPRWLAQQISGAQQEVLIAVSRITRERPRGEHALRSRFCRNF
jgi:hypothetical protein